MLKSVLDQMQRTIQQSIALISYNWSTSEIKNGQHSFKFAAFSDLVVLSLAIDKNNIHSECLLGFLLHIVCIQIEIFKHGFLSRGYVTKGLLYHNQQIVFGNALIKAYKHEKDNVIYPRVNIDAEALDFVKANTQEYKDNLKYLVEFEERVPFLNFMNGFISNTPSGIDYNIKYINSTLAEYKAQEKVFKKWYWIAQQFCNQYNNKVINHKLSISQDNPQIIEKSFSFDYSRYSSDRNKMAIAQLNTYFS